MSSHKKRTRQWSVALAVALGVFGACKDETPTDLNLPGVQGSLMGTASASEHPGEAAFEEISKAVPAFGGFFLEGDNIVVYVTDPTKGAAAQAAVRNHFAAGSQGAADRRLAHAPFATRVARYNFGQLRDWRNQVKHDVLLTHPDAAWIDLDEARNQVAIGLATGSGRRDVLESVRRLGVPPDAIRIEVTGRDTPNDVLASRVRPVVGGLAHAVTFNGVSQLVPWCTFAFNARYNSTDVILTASHCTSRTYGNDLTPTVFYQNTITAPDRIGSETYDPAATGTHRFSDAAMILYDAGVSFSLGYLARTTSRSMTWGTDGSKTIDAANPRFRVTAKQSYPVANVRVEKVGWKTGWTSGLITATCVDLLGSDNWWRDCSYKAGYWSDGGDSGAPVFVWNGDTTVTLVGIHWGHNTQGQYSDFSPMGGILQDFGSMVVELPLPPPPLAPPTNCQMVRQGPPPPQPTTYLKVTWTNGTPSASTEVTIIRGGVPVFTTTVSPGLTSYFYPPNGQGGQYWAQARHVSGGLTSAYCTTNSVTINN